METITFTMTQRDPETLARQIAREKFRARSGDEFSCTLCGKPLTCRTHTMGDGTIVRMGYQDCECDGFKAAYQQILADETQKYNARINEMRRRRIDSLICQSGLGERFRQRTFDTFIAETEWQQKALETAKEFCQNMIDGKSNVPGLLLSGTVGTGKTHLAAAITIRMSEDGCSVIFGTAASLLAKIRNGWNDENEANAIEEMCRVPLLVIDDLGKQYSRKNSDGWSWAQEQFFAIINARYENYMPTVITTNYDMEKLTEAMGEAIVSRLVESCRGVRCDGEDYRMRKWKIDGGD